MNYNDMKIYFFRLDTGKDKRITEKEFIDGKAAIEKVGVKLQIKKSFCSVF